MFCVIYRFEVLPGRETEFMEAWRAITEHYRETRGALGSRLHKEADGKYIAYAQWPDRERWANPDITADEAIAVQRAAMPACCTHIGTLHEMEVVDDLLVK